MSQFHLVLQILVLCGYFFARQILGGQLPLTTHEENIGVSGELMSPKANTTSQQDIDPKFNSSYTLMPIEVPYGQAFPSLQTDGVEDAYFATHRIEYSDTGYYGLSATMDVYGFNLDGTQVTTGAIWINNYEGDATKNLNSIIVGWIVWPSRYNDSHTHLFTVWTKDNHQNIGCVDLDCPGFRLVSGSPIFPADIIAPVSDANGSARQNITIKVSKDMSSGDWWLYCGVNSDPVAVGYFPASLFDSLAVKATEILVGGHTRDTVGATPPMGSGAFSSDPQKSASVRDIWLIHADGSSTPMDEGTPTWVTDNIYSVSPIAGAKFFYGGPGGHST